MRSPHLRHVVVDRIGIVGLLQIRDRRSHDEGIENGVLDAFNGWRQRHDAGSADARYESLRRQSRPHAARRMPYVVGIAHVAQAEFVHRGWPERFRIAEIHQLRASQSHRIESRNARAALAGRVRIVQAVVVEEVVGGKQSKTFAVGVHFEAALVVAHDLVPPRWWKRSRLPCWEDGMYCSRCCAGDDHTLCGMHTAGKNLAVRLVRRHRITQLLRQQIRPGMDRSLHPSDCCRNCRPVRPTSAPESSPYRFLARSAFPDNRRSRKSCLS